MNTILVTGSAGFIGFYVSKALLESDHTVIGYDNLNDYYDPELKKSRIRILMNYRNYIFYKADICDTRKLNDVADKYQIDVIIHLAAQAGVRYSLEYPEKYINTNIIGTFRILELCRTHRIGHLMYASSSSVYGDSGEEKLRPDLKTDFPVSLYAATKKCDEVLVHTYCNNYKLNAIGMRFFTVYGPYGRPDMAYFTFVDKILHNKTIELYNYGRQERDFTYIDDLLDGVIKLFYYHQTVKAGTGSYIIVNIGNGNPVQLMTFTNLLEKITGIEARKILCEKRTGDVEHTFADISALQKLCDYHPETDIEQGLRHFYDWYKDYYLQK